MSQQLELALQPRKTPARQRPVVDRLFEIIHRQGINTSRTNSKGRVMFRPEFTRPVGFYIDLCSGWSCLDRADTLFTWGYGNRAEEKRQAAQGGKP